MEFSSVSTLCTSVTRDDIVTDCSAVFLTEQMVSASLFHWDRQRRNHEVCQWLWRLCTVSGSIGFVVCDHYFRAPSTACLRDWIFLCLYVKQWEDTKSNWPKSTDSPSPLHLCKTVLCLKSRNPVIPRGCVSSSPTHTVFHLFVEGLKVYYYSNILNIEFVNVNFQTLQKVKDRNFYRRVQNTIYLLYCKHKLQQEYACTSL